MGLETVVLEVRLDLTIFVFSFTQKHVKKPSFSLLLHQFLSPGFGLQPWAVPWNVISILPALFVSHLRKEQLPALIELS